MNKAYVLITGADLARQSVTDFLDTMPEVSFWYACLPHCVFLASELTTDDLAQRMMAAFPNKMLLVLEASSEGQGRLPLQAWRLLNNPEVTRFDRQLTAEAS